MTKPKTKATPVKQDEMIRHLAKLLDETNLTEIEIESDQVRVRIARQSAIPQVTVPAASAGPVAVENLPSQQATPNGAPGTDDQDMSKHPGAVKAPMVGTSYLAPSPEAPSFVTEGASVNKGDTLLVIEAMKVMNQIKAPQSGVIKKILCQNAEPVEFGQVLMIIE